MYNLGRVNSAQGHEALSWCTHAYCYKEELLVTRRGVTLFRDPVHYHSSHSWHTSGSMDAPRPPPAGSASLDCAAKAEHTGKRNSASAAKHLRLSTLTHPLNQISSIWRDTVWNLVLDLGDFAICSWNRVIQLSLVQVLCDKSRHHYALHLPECPLRSSKGGTPTRNSYVSTPRAQRSTLSVWSRPSTISGGK